MKKQFCIYIHTFPNNKKYVGSTFKDVEKRWGKNGKHYSKQIKVWNAIQEYGWENVKHEIIASGLTKEEAERLENQTIHELRTLEDEFGYNVKNTKHLPDVKIPSKKIVSITLEEKTIAKLKQKAKEWDISLSTLIELIIKGVIKL